MTGRLRNRKPENVIREVLDSADSMLYQLFKQWERLREDDMEAAERDIAWLRDVPSKDRRDAEYAINLLWQIRRRRYEVMLNAVPDYVKYLRSSFRPEIVEQQSERGVD